MGASCTKAGREEAAFLKAAKDGECRLVQQAILRDVEWACKVQTWNGQSVFHLAARYGRLDVLDTVVEAVRFNPAGPDKWTRLLRMGHSTDAILRAFANLQDARCQTPLHLACIYGHHQVAERLLQLGATPWTWDELGGRTPLHYAASMGHVDVIRVIISHNARAPTGEALRRPNSSRTRLVDICNDSGYTPLHYAVWAGSAAAVRALTSYEASLSARNVACGSDWVVSCLKCTPLHLAAHKGNQIIVKLLLSAYVQYQPPQGADALPVTDRRRRDPRRHVNANRQLPYHVAVSRNHNHLAEMLHPDVPFSFILSPAEMESRLYGVPKLAALAAKTLQSKLFADIEAAVAALAAVPTARGTATSGGSITAGRTRSGGLTALSGAVVAAATGQAAGGAAAATAAAQHVLAAATARLRSVNERSLHGGTAALSALDAAVLAATQQQQRPASMDRLPVAPTTEAAATPPPPPLVVTAPAGNTAAGAVGCATAAVSAAAVSNGAAAVVVTNGSSAAKATSSAPSSGKSSATSGVDSEKDALALDPVPGVSSRPTTAEGGGAGSQQQPPPLPLPPAPISPFLPGTPSAGANGPGGPGAAGVPGGRVPTFNEAASAFALFAAEPFDEPAAGGAGGAAALQPAGSSSVSLAVLARNRAQQAGGASLLPAGSNSVSIATLARGGRTQVGATSVNKIAPSRSRSLRSLLTVGKNRRSNTTNVGAGGATSSASQQQSFQQRGDLSPGDDLLGDGDLADDLDDILNAMQPGGEADGAADGPAAAAAAAALAAAHRGAAPAGDNTPAAATSLAAVAAPATTTGRTSNTPTAAPPSRGRSSGGGGGTRPFWRRSSTATQAAAAAAYPTGVDQATTESGSPYTGSVHAGGSAASALAAAATATANTAPSETLLPASSIRSRAPSLPAAVPPGVIESRASTEVSDVEVTVPTGRRFPPSAAAPSPGITPIDSMDDDTDDGGDAVARSSAGTRSLRRSSISVAALAREAALPPPTPPAGEQEQVDGAVLAMLASLVEAPQHVLRRYRLLQLTHGLDLQDLLRDHSEQAGGSVAVAAAAAAAAGGGCGYGGCDVPPRASGVEGTLLPSTGSEPNPSVVAAAAAAVAAGDASAALPVPPALLANGSLRSPAGAGSLQAPRRPAGAAEGGGGGGGEDNLTAIVAAAAAATVAIRASLDANAAPSPRAPTGPPTTLQSPFAQEAGLATTFCGASLNGAGSPGPGPIGSGAVGATTTAVSANLAGQLLRTLSSHAASESGEGTCGVCFDQPDVLSIKGCGHRLCTDCSRELCKLNTLKPALCPFCRGMIGGFKFVGRG